ncbi:MAG: SGNH/GDSL hydrolase family protein [Treponema sp.]|nr:SGNH/GDSL hydrolase family protein [Treponema sp.]
MELGHLFEAAMLICFGFSWPINVVKAYKARTAKGTSLAFIFLIITGYLAGITAKFLNGQLNYVLVVYFLNLAIVMTNVFVYFRNVRLDNKKQSVQTKQKIYELQQKFKSNKTFQEEDMNYQELNTVAKKNAVILMGGDLDKQIPVAELAQSFDFNFQIYNRSEEKLSVKQARTFFQDNINAMEPEGIIIHLGDSDMNLFKTNSADFDKYYLTLLAAVKACNKKCRIALVSVNNPNSDKTIAEMNRHIKALADSEKAVFINLDNAKLWNPQAAKASVSFAYGMGLKVRKPLTDVAEILYSYAYTEIKPETLGTELVG